MRWSRRRLIQPRAAGWSLSVRLAWRLSLFVVVAMLLSAGAVAWRTVATVHDLDDAALQQQVRVVADNLPPASADDAPLKLPADVVAPFRASDADNVFMVYGQTGRLLATSDGQTAADAAPFLPTPLQEGLFRVPAVTGDQQGMVGYVLPAGNRWVVVLQGREQADVLADSLMEHFLFGAVWILLPLGCAMVVVSLVTLRRGLRPLTDASAAAASVGPSHPGLRLPVADLPREVTPLVLAVNAALARLEQTIEAQRVFMAEAAHGLRTPLAVLTARLDSLGDIPEVEGLRRDADRMSRLVGQLLRMARLESLPLDVTEPVDLRVVAVEAITDLAPLGLLHGVNLALLGAEGRVPARGNHAALVLAVTNLIENAIGYAPSESVVEVELTAPGQIAVMDRGPGVAPEHRDRILRPFERGPAARAGGAGLGLAIVAQIAAAHGGTLRMEPRPGGGSCFVLQLSSAARAFGDGARTA